MDIAGLRRAAPRAEGEKRAPRRAHGASAISFFNGGRRWPGPRKHMDNPRPGHEWTAPTCGVPPVPGQGGPSASAPRTQGQGQRERRSRRSWPRSSAIPPEGTSRCRQRRPPTSRPTAWHVRQPLDGPSSGGPPLAVVSRKVARQGPRLIAATMLETRAPRDLAWEKGPLVRQGATPRKGRHGSRTSPSAPYSGEGHAGGAWKAGLGRPGHLRPAQPDVSLRRPTSPSSTSTLTPHRWTVPALHRGRRLAGVRHQTR